MKGIEGGERKRERPLPPKQKRMNRQDDRSCHKNYSHLSYLLAPNKEMDLAYLLADVRALRPWLGAPGYATKVTMQWIYLQQGVPCCAMEHRAAVCLATFPYLNAMGSMDGLSSNPNPQLHKTPTDPRSPFLLVILRSFYLFFFSLLHPLHQLS